MANAETEPAQAHEPTDPVLHATLYDRVVSLLMSVMITTGATTAALGVTWWASLPAEKGDGFVQLTTIDVDLGEDWGGEPDGGPGESWAVEGPESSEPSLGGEVDSTGVPDSEVQRAVTSVLDRVEEAVANADELRVENDGVAGLRRGWRGTEPRRPLGDGVGGTRGVPLNRRWEIRFAPGLTVEEYARQLDFLQVELGVIVDGKLYRVSQHGLPRPKLREADLALARKELFFIWRDESRRQVDLSLVRRSLLQSVPDQSVVMHFYPMATIQQLGDLERSHAASHGRLSLRDVAKTRFTVQRLESGYQFEITQQTYLASTAQ